MDLSSEELDYEEEYRTLEYILPELEEEEAPPIAADHPPAPAESSAATLLSVLETQTVNLAEVCESPASHVPLRRPKSVTACSAHACKELFRSPADLEKHWRDVHYPTTTMFHCPFPNCTKRYPNSHRYVTNHIRALHHPDAGQMKQLTKLPMIVSCKDNARFAAPGIPFPYDPLDVAGAVGVSEGKTLNSKVRAIMGQASPKRPKLTVTLQSQTTPPKGRPSATTVAPVPTVKSSTLKSGPSATIVAPVPDPVPSSTSVPRVPRGATTESLQQFVSQVRQMKRQLQVEEEKALAKITSSADRRIRELEASLAVREASLAESERLRKLADDRLAASLKQTRLLQKQVEKLTAGRNPLPVPLQVGILQRTPITRPVALLPRGPNTDVVELDSRDIHLLDAETRDVMMSFDII